MYVLTYLNKGLNKIRIYYRRYSSGPLFIYFCRLSLIEKKKMKKRKEEKKKRKKKKKRKVCDPFICKVPNREKVRERERKIFTTLEGSTDE